MVACSKKGGVSGDGGAGATGSTGAAGPLNATLALKKDDPKTAAVAVETIYAQFDYLGDEGKKANATPAAVDLILAAYKDSTGPRGVRRRTPASARMAVSTPSPS